MISSYTPTLTALLRARNAPAPTVRPMLLAIGMPTTSNATDLPYVPEELARIHARYPITTRLQSPTRDQHHSSLTDPGPQPTHHRGPRRPIRSRLATPGLPCSTTPSVHCALSAPQTPSPRPHTFTPAPNDFWSFPAVRANERGHRGIGGHREPIGGQVGGPGR